jgi:nucleoside-diphosphate-sugar epimerase
VRLFQVYGPGQPERSLIPAAIRAALSGENFAMTPGDQERDFPYVQDVVEGMVATAEAAGIEGRSLDLGTGTGRAVRHVVARIWQLTDAKGQVQAGALSYRQGEAMHLVADADRTAQLTGWRATTPLDEGLRATLESLQSRT